MEWKKMLASHVSNMGLISRIYKEFIIFNNDKPNNLFSKTRQNINRPFPEKNIYKQTVSVLKDDKPCKPSWKINIVVAMQSLGNVFLVQNHCTWLPL